MNSIDRPLLAGLLCGLLACVTFSNLITSSAFADENELRERIPIEVQRRIAIAIHEAKEEMAREHEEREQMEQMELEHQTRREREERERSARDRALDHEMRELEIRRQHIELRATEMELNERSIAPSNEVAFEAINTAIEHLEPEAAAEFFADLLGDVKSPAVKNHLRLRLAGLYFRTDRPDQATKQLRMLIAP